MYNEEKAAMMGMDLSDDKVCSTRVRGWRRPPAAHPLLSTPPHTAPPTPSHLDREHPHYLPHTALQKELRKERAILTENEEKWEQRREAERVERVAAKKEARERSKYEVEKKEFEDKQVRG